VREGKGGVDKVEEGREGGGRRAWRWWFGVDLVVGLLVVDLLGVGFILRRFWGRVMVVSSGSESESESVVGGGASSDPELDSAESVSSHASFCCNSDVLLLVDAV
jgi:hypothetical protein